MRRRKLVCGILASLVLSSVAAASNRPDVEALYDSSVGLHNKSDTDVSVRVRPRGHDWQDRTITADQELWVTCGGCLTNGFDIIIDADEVVTRYFLPSGYRFSLRWLDDARRWDVYLVPWQ